MPLDQALETISTNPYFLQLRQDFEWANQPGAGSQAPRSL